MNDIGKIDHRTAINTITKQTFEVRDRRDGNWFWADNDFLRARIPQTIKIVYFVLCSYANKNTEVTFPSIDRMAEDAGVSRSSVIRGLNRLKDAKLIEITKLATQHSSNHYALLPVRGVNSTLLQGCQKTAVRGVKTNAPEVSPQILEQTKLTNEKNKSDKIANKRKPITQKEKEQRLEEARSRLLQQVSAYKEKQST